MKKTNRHVQRILKGGGRCVIINKTQERQLRIITTLTNRGHARLFDTIERRTAPCVDNKLPFNVLHSARILWDANSTKRDYDSLLTVSVFLVSMIIAGVVILDAVRELVLGMRHVVYLAMAVLIVDNYFVSGALHRAMKVRKAVSMSCQSTLDRHEG